jgi:hypothetical protein
MLCAVWLAVANAPAAQIGDHAIERHGWQASEALRQNQSGTCTRVYRSADYRIWIRVVDGNNPLLAFGIIQRAAGQPVTSYIAPRAYWAVRVAGYVYEGTEGTCQSAGDGAHE